MVKHGNSTTLPVFSARSSAATTTQIINPVHGRGANASVSSLLDACLGAPQDARMNRHQVRMMMMMKTPSAAYIRPAQENNQAIVINVKNSMKKKRMKYLDPLPMTSTTELDHNILGFDRFENAVISNQSIIPTKLPHEDHGHLPPNQNQTEEKALVPTKPRLTPSKVQVKNHHADALSPNADELIKGTTRARYRRLVGMVARKQLSCIHQQATQRIAQRRQLEWTAVVCLQTNTRRFLSVTRKRNQQIRAAQLIQTAWRRYHHYQQLQRAKEQTMRVESAGRRLVRWYRSLVHRWKWKQSMQQRDQQRQEEKQQAAWIVLRFMRAWCAAQRTRKQRLVNKAETLHQQQEVMKQEPSNDGSLMHESVLSIDQIEQAIKRKPDAVLHAVESQDDHRQSRAVVQEATAMRLERPATDGAVVHCSDDDSAPECFHPPQSAPAEELVASVRLAIAGNLTEVNEPMNHQEPMDPVVSIKYAPAPHVFSNQTLASITNPTPSTANLHTLTGQQATTANGMDDATALTVYDTMEELRTQRHETCLPSIATPVVTVDRTEWARLRIQWFLVHSMHRQRDEATRQRHNLAATTIQCFVRQFQAKNQLNRQRGLRIEQLRRELDQTPLVRWHDLDDRTSTEIPALAPRQLRFLPLKQQQLPPGVHAFVTDTLEASGAPLWHWDWRDERWRPYKNKTC